MIRHCDGADPSLIRPSLSAPDTVTPCDCGNTFDDVDHSTIFPHNYIPSQEVRLRWMAEAEAALHNNRVDTGVLAAYFTPPTQGDTA